MMSNKQQDYKISKIASLLFIFPIIRDFLRLITTSIGVNYIYGHLLVYLVYSLIIGYYYIFYGSKYLLKLILIEIVYLLIIAFTYLIFSNNRPYIADELEKIMMFGIIYFPLLLLINQISDFKIFIRISSKTSIIGILILLLSIPFGFLKVYGYMVFSIYSLPLLVVLVTKIIFEKNTLNVISTIILSLMIVIFGGRMALVSVVFIYIYYFLSIVNKKKRNASIKIIIVISLATLILIFNSVLLDFFIWIFNQFGIESRNLVLLKERELTDFGYRTVIYNEIWKDILSNNFAIRGLFGDRIIISERLTNVTYPHNIILEMLVHFGILAIPILLLLTYKSFKVLSFKDIIRKDFTLLYILYIIPRLLVSASYIVEAGFYVWLFLIMYKQRQNRRILV